MIYLEHSRVLRFFCDGCKRERPDFRRCCPDAEMRGIWGERTLYVGRENVKPDGVDLHTWFLNVQDIVWS